MTETYLISPEERDRADIEQARAFWSGVSGLPPGDLVFPDPLPAWRRQLQDRWPRGMHILVRLRIWPEPDAPSPIFLNVIPLNLAPWTNARLPGIAEESAEAPAARLADRLADRLIWHLAHPSTRYERLACHRAQRRNSVPRWRRHKLRATLRARAPGPPPWLEDA